MFAQNPGWPHLLEQAVSEKSGSYSLVHRKASDQLAVVLQLTSETEPPGPQLRPLHLPTQAGAPTAAVPSLAAALSR